MKIRTNCGMKTEESQNLCNTCKKEVEVPFGETEKEPVADSLFDKMEDCVSAENNCSEFQKMNEEYRERELIRAYLQKQKSMSGNYLLGFIGALLGGFVGSIPWILAASRGRFIAWLGYLIAVVASKGYDLMKIKAGMKKLWCVGISVVICVFTGQIISDMVAIATDEELSGMFSEIFSYYVSNPGEYFALNAKNMLFGLLFALLAGLRIFREIKRESMMIEELKATDPECEDI